MDQGINAPHITETQSVLGMSASSDCARMTTTVKKTQAMFRAMFATALLPTSHNVAIMRQRARLMTLMMADHMAFANTLAMRSPHASVIFTDDLKQQWARVARAPTTTAEDIEAKIGDLMGLVQELQALLSYLQFLTATKQSKKLLRLRCVVGCRNDIRRFVKVATRMGQPARVLRLSGSDCTQSTTVYRHSTSA